MNSHTKESCIQLLKKLRDAYQGQLDTSVIVEINEVIEALENEETCCTASGLAPGERALNVISLVLRIVTNISELIQ